MRKLITSLNQLTRLIVAACIGLVSGFACYTIQFQYSRGAGDLGYVTRLFVDLIHGIDPYSYPATLTPMSYPLTAALAVAPFSFLPPEAAAGVFFGLSSVLLVLALTQNRTWWPLLTLLALPYWQALLTVQWSPLFLAIALYPALLPLTLCKPTIGFPVAIVNLTRRRVLASLGFLLVSLVVLPDWPIRWLGHQADPSQYIPPLFRLPLGPILLLAILRWRDQRARFLLTLAIVPQRLWYDMLLVFFIVRTPRQGLLLVAGTWLAFWIWRLFLPNLAEMLVLFFVYMPALAIIFLPTRPSGNEPAISMKQFNAPV